MSNPCDPTAGTRALRAIELPARPPGPAAPGVQTCPTARPDMFLFGILYVSSAASAPGKERTDDV